MTLAVSQNQLKKRMETELAFQTLIELFNKSLAHPELATKHYLEVITHHRREALTFQQLQTAAQDLALWLIQARDVRIGHKVAILGKNRIDWDIALWAIILAGAVPVLIDPERPPEAVKQHVTSTDTHMLVMADDYHDTDSQNHLKEFSTDRRLGLIEMTGSQFCGLPNATICTAPTLLKQANDKPLWGPCTICQEQTPAGRYKLLSEIAPQINPGDTAAIVCTSGTTDDPREVELTHANLIANIQGALQTVKITGDDKLGHIIPPHHSFGFTVTKLLPLWVGATNVYTNNYRRIADIIRDKDITVFIGIPALFSVLARKLEEHLAKLKQKSLLARLADRCLPKSVGKKIIEKQGWQNLRFFLCGAAPMPRWTLQAFWKRGLKLYEGYGTTENSPVYGFNDSPQRLGSVGKPIPTLSVKIVNEKNQTLKPGQVGEILLGGPCIMKGYYKNPKATDAVIKTDDNGVRWLHTGDLGYLDRDGHLFITGRKKYVIVLPGGKNVNPELVESVLSQADYVKEILVVPASKSPGSPAPTSEEAVAAIVQPAWDQIQTSTNLSYDDLVKQPQVLKSLVWQSINECQKKSRQLSHFEKVAPHRLQIKIDEFTKTSTGKIKRDLYINVSR